MEEQKRLDALELLHKMRNGAIKEKAKLEHMLPELGDDPLIVKLCAMKLSHYDDEIQYFEDEIAKHAIWEEEQS